MSQEPTYVGIDVSKERMDVAVRPTGRNWSVSYDEAGVDDLVAQLKPESTEARCDITVTGQDGTGDATVWADFG